MVMILSVFALTACNKDKDSGEKRVEVTELNGKTPEQVYDAAVATLASITNLTINQEQTINMAMDGESAGSQKQTIITKLDGHNEYASISSSVMNIETWYIDEWLYTSTSGSNTKQHIPYDTWVETYYPDGGVNETALLNIPEEWFQDTVKFYKEGDDLYCLEFVVSGDKYKEFFDNFDSIFDMCKKIGDITYRIYFDGEGNLGDIYTYFEYTIEAAGYTIDCKCDTISKVTDIGSTVITAPTGTFTDVTAE